MSALLQRRAGSRRVHLRCVFRLLLHQATVCHGRLGLGQRAAQRIDIDEASC